MLDPAFISLVCAHLGGLGPSAKALPLASFIYPFKGNSQAGHLWWPLSVAGDL